MRRFRRASGSTCATGLQNALFMDSNTGWPSSQDGVKMTYDGRMTKNTACTACSHFKSWNFQHTNAVTASTCWYLQILMRSHLIRLKIAGFSLGRLLNDLNVQNVHAETASGHWNSQHSYAEMALHDGNKSISHAAATG